MCLTIGLLAMAMPTRAETVWIEDFEGPTPGWGPDAGVWEIGIPTSGPGDDHQPDGDRCAGTVLAGDYPNYADSRLITPSFVVPAAVENPRLRFWHWFSTYSSGDYGVVQVREGGGSWEPKPLSATYSRDGGAWTRASVDLSGLAGKNVEIAFRFVSDSGGTRSGWFIDEVEVVTGAFESPNTDFEGDLGDWHSERGVWEIGIPTSGPGDDHQQDGDRCAGTVLGGNYPSYADSRLISPPFVVPAAAENPRLRFWHWFSTYSSGDYGVVQIREDGGSWQDASPEYAYAAGAWTRPSVDLSGFASKKVEIGLRFVSDSGGTRSGWFVDEVEVVTGTFEPPGTDFESGLGDWHPERGVWEIGIPASGPEDDHQQDGDRCAGTVLAGDYPSHADSRLISPPFVVPVAAENPRLRFWHWFSTYSTGDYGVVQIREEGGSWQNASPKYAYAGGAWTRPSVDLAGYAGKKVEIGLRFVSDSGGTRSGWFVDEVEVATGEFWFPNPDGFEGGLRDWHAERGLWEVGTPAWGLTGAHEGDYCAGTVLAADYPSHADSRLISPPFIVPPAAVNPRLRFWHWFSTYSSGDYGVVQVREEGGSWQEVSLNYSGDSGPGTSPLLDLSDFAERSIELAFRFVSDSGGTDPGWYIDEVGIETDIFFAMHDEYDVDEGDLLIFDAEPNLEGLIFRACSEFPTDAEVTPNGHFEWTPSEQQGPGIYWMTICAYMPGDSLDPVASKDFMVIVNEANAQPELDRFPVGDGETIEIDEQTELRFKATATDRDNTNLPYQWFLAHQDFSDLSLEPWTAYSRASNRAWEARCFGTERCYAQLNGVGADEPCDDWLISPGLDFTGSTDQVLTFETAKINAGPDLQVLVSTDYDSSSDPAGASWVALDAKLSAGNEDVVASGAIDLSAYAGESSVHIAFRYTSTAAEAPIWQVGDIWVTGTFPAFSQKLSFSLEPGAPEGAQIDPDSGEFSWLPSEEQGPDIYPIGITVTDDGEPGLPPLSHTRTLTVDVKEVNLPPELPELDDRTVNEETLMIVVATATDPDLPHNALTYALIEAPEGAEVDEDGIIRWTPSEGQGPGLYGFTVQVTDDSPDAVDEKNLSDTESFSVNVLEVNLPPTFTLGPPPIVLEDSGPYTGSNWLTDISAGPPCDAGTAVDFIVTPDDPTLFAVQPAVSPEGTLTFTPAPDACGETTVSMVAKDDGGTENGGVDTSEPQIFRITILCVNDAPSFAKGDDQEVCEDAGEQTIPGWVTDISPGPANESEQQVDFELSADDPSLFAVLPAVAPDGTLTYTAASDACGESIVSIVAKDDGGTENGGVDTSEPQIFRITIRCVNDAPTFTKGDDQEVCEDAGEQTVLWATDISPGPDDESEQEVGFEVVSDNDELFAMSPAIAPDGTLTYTPAPDAYGVAVVSVTPKDDGGTDPECGGADTGETQTFTITVKPVNDPPSFTGGEDQEVCEDAGEQTMLWATDISPGPDNESEQAVEFAVSNDNPDLFQVQPAISPDGTLTYISAPDANGVAIVSVTLEDDGGTDTECGGSDTGETQTFTIPVRPVNDPPYFTAGISKGEDQVVCEDAGSQTIPELFGDISVSPGPDNEFEQDAWCEVSNDNPDLFEVQPAVSPEGTLTYTPKSDAQGAATVSLIPKDDGGTDPECGGSDTGETQTFLITVKPVNDPPSFTAGGDQGVPPNAGHQTIPDWATDISPGPENESEQAVDFEVSNDNPGLFEVQPDVSPDGTLTYATAPNATGMATCTVTLKDEGGTDSECGGSDISGPETFTISVGPPLMPTIVQRSAPDGSRLIRICYPIYEGRTHTVEFRDGLGDSDVWQALPNTPHNEGCVEIPVEGLHRFYRIRVH